MQRGDQHKNGPGRGIPYSGEMPDFGRKCFASGWREAQDAAGQFSLMRAVRLQLLIWIACLAQSALADLSWSVRTWQIPDGSTNAVSGVVQTADGYLWIGTTAGLNQFDGISFENHAFGKALGLKDSRVRRML